MTVALQFNWLMQFVPLPICLQLGINWNHPSKLPLSTQALPLLSVLVFPHLFPWTLFSYKSSNTHDTWNTSSGNSITVGKKYLGYERNPGPFTFASESTHYGRERLLVHRFIPLYKNDPRTPLPKSKQGRVLSVVLLCETNKPNKGHHWELACFYLHTFSYFLNPFFTRCMLLWGCVARTLGGTGRTCKLPIERPRTFQWDAEIQCINTT